MVPAADILNHIANHNANLEYSAVSGPLSLPGQVVCITSQITGLQFPTSGENAVTLATLLCTFGVELQ